MSDTTNRIAGIAYLQIDGETHMLAGELTYSPIKVKRETKSGQDGVHGYGEMPAPPFISGTLRDSGSLTVADFNAMTNVTVTLNLANGKTVIGRNMWTVDAQEVNTTEGTFDLKFEGFDGCITEQ